MMDLLSAVELFYLHGNVGTCPDDLLRVAPTIPQLKSAVEVALRNGMNPAEVSQAATVVMAHFGLTEVQ